MVNAAGAVQSLINHIGMCKNGVLLVVEHFTEIWSSVSKANFSIMNTSER